MPNDTFASGAIALDRSSSTSLWAQLEAELRRRLDDGHFDRRFPTDRELMEIYGVSRHTARHAIGRLGASGVVRRSRGIGTSLDRPTLARSLGSLYHLRQVLEDDDIPHACRVLAQHVVVDPDVAERLGLATDVEFVHVSRLRIVGGEPFSIDQVWIVAEVAGDLMAVDFTTHSLYDEFERIVGRRPNAGWERITATSPSATERELLGTTDMAALFVERLGRLDDDAVEWRRTVVRGDRLALVNDWTAGQRHDQRVEVATPVP